MVKANTNQVICTHNKTVSLLNGQKTFGTKAVRKQKKGRPRIRREDHVKEASEKMGKETGEGL